MSMNAGTKWFVTILLGLSLGLAALFVWHRSSVNDVEGFYAVADSLLDVSDSEAAAIYFVKVEAYDTTKILRSAERIAQSIIMSPKLNSGRKRTMLFHFFKPGDTAGLSPVELDELAYTHPEITEPASMLYVVPGGWVVRAVFSPNKMQPQSVKLAPSRFYMPRPGVKAYDLR